MKQSKIFSNYAHDLPPLDDPFTCRHCGFEGIYMDTYERRFRESEGTHTRGGTRFTCKKCNGVVLEVIDLRS